jgi:hypothetical protein
MKNVCQNKIFDGKIFIKNVEKLGLYFSVLASFFGKGCGG